MDTPPRPRRRRGWWTTFTWDRTTIAAALSLGAVPLLAVVTKQIVERLTNLSYEIHWQTTVPALVLLFALAMNRLFNEEAGRARRTR